jgi:hypothetical protein
MRSLNFLEIIFKKLDFQICMGLFRVRFNLEIENFVCQFLL